MEKLKHSLLFAAVMMLVAVPQAKAEEIKRPYVVSTIAPIHAIVSRILGNRGTAELIVPPGASPHHYQLTPSDRKKIQDADFLVLVHPDFETFLKGMDVKNTLPLAIQKNMTLVKAEAGHTHNGKESEYDYHMWLDITNMQALSGLLLEALKAMSPENAAYYETSAAVNALPLSKSYYEMDQFLMLVKDEPFATYHPSLSYIVSRFEMNHVGSLVYDHAESLSAKRLKELKRKMQEQDVGCIFVDQHAPERALQTLAKETDATVVSLDLMGNGEDYEGMMKEITKEMLKCLALEFYKDMQEKEATEGEGAESQDAL